ncbi:jg13771 [Pararge aegeria aegeria]|uniref:Jg13771 protein n=1 Tax=Pararge aegeria aegeria TaxID=348720 RepID=A0A8S4S965_9NEOP|nr:jg13771 [Pararge aegeria aegeria]
MLVIYVAQRSKRFQLQLLIFSWNPKPDFLRFPRLIPNLYPQKPYGSHSPMIHAARLTYGGDKSYIPDKG